MMLNEMEINNVNETSLNNNISNREKKEEGINKEDINFITYNKNQVNKTEKTLQ